MVVMVVQALSLVREEVWISGLRSIGTCSGLGEEGEYVVTSGREMDGFGRGRGMLVWDG